MRLVKASSLTTLLGLGAACAACCLIPGAAVLAGGALYGALTAGAGFGLFGWLGAAGALALTALGVTLAWRRLRPKSCAAPQAVACGCVSSAPPTNATKANVPIACTLSPQDRKAQGERIRLTRNALRAVRREPLQVHLTYAKEAAEQVRDVVRVESSCCAFLDFDLRDDAHGVQLTITAPERAKEVAQLLFDQFAPAASSASPPWRA
jgi:hypothetical protein